MTVLGSTYTALGASNTCGHGLKAREVPFQSLLYDALKLRQGVRTFQPSCIAAMGPEYPASCLDYFAPNATSFATVEFTPNMGAIGAELDRSTTYLESMVSRLRRRRVHVAIIDLVPRPPTCETCIAGFEAAHAKVERVARRTRVPLITLHYNETYWSDDLKHLNAEGHRYVAAQTMEAFEAAIEHEHAPSSSPMPTRFRARRKALRDEGGGSDGGGGGGNGSNADEVAIPRCVFGPDLTNLMLPDSLGFHLLQTGKHKDKPGLLGTAPGALLRLCLRDLPTSFGVSLAFERSDVLPMSNVSRASSTPRRPPPSRPHAQTRA